jgi:hypothetical protein
MGRCAGMAWIGVRCRTAGEQHGEHKAKRCKRQHPSDDQPRSDPHHVLAVSLARLEPFDKFLKPPRLEWPMR